MKRRKILFLLQILAALLVSANAGLGIYLNSPSLQNFISHNIFPQREEVSAFLPPPLVLQSPQISHHQPASPIALDIASSPPESKSPGSAQNSSLQTSRSKGATNQGYNPASPNAVLPIDRTLSPE